MAVRLFAMSDVPEDEAEEVRALLTSNGIDYYETPAGNWGISVPAIWLRNDEQRELARRLLDGYQAERAARMRSEYQRQREEGCHRTVWDVLRENPLRFVGYLIAVAVVVYFSTKPFLDISR